MVEKLVKSMPRTPFEYSKTIDQITFASKTEKEIFEKADDREEYYQNLAEQAYKMKQGLQEKKEEEHEFSVELKEIKKSESSTEKPIKEEEGSSVPPCRSRRRVSFIEASKNSLINDDCQLTDPLLNPLSTPDHELKPPQPILKEKRWHKSITEGMRDRNVGALLKVLQPDSDNSEEIVNDMTVEAKAIEGNFYENARDLDEYYHLVYEKINTITKEAQGEKSFWNGDRLQEMDADRAHVDSVKTEWMDLIMNRVKADSSKNESDAEKKKRLRKDWEQKGLSNIVKMLQNMKIDKTDENYRSEDDIKQKMVEQQLVLLLHAYKCLLRDNEERGNIGICSIPHCISLKYALRHIPSCKDGLSCKYDRCASSRLIIAHTWMCRFNCEMCQPFEKTWATFADSIDVDDFFSLADLTSVNAVLEVPVQELICEMPEPSNNSLIKGLPEPEPPSKSKHWHLTATCNRKELVVKLVNSVVPKPDSKAIQEPTVKKWIQKAIKHEKESFEKSDDLEEYYHFLAEFVYDLWSRPSTSSTPDEPVPVPTPEPVTNVTEIKQEEELSDAPSKMTLTSNQRAYIVGKIVKLIMPSTDPNDLQGSKITDWITYAKSTENWQFEKASDREDYFRLLAEKIFMVQKMLKEKMDSVRRLESKLVHDNYYFLLDQAEREREEQCLFDVLLVSRSEANTMQTIANNLKKDVEKVKRETHSEKEDQPTTSFTSGRE